MASHDEVLVQGTQNYAIEELVPVNEFDQAHSYDHQLGRIAARAALALGVALGVVGGQSSITAPLSLAAETGGYPDANATDCSAVYGMYSWCQPHDDWISPRGYGYRNCTDWVAFRIPQLVQKAVPIGWSDAKNWDEAAGAAHYTVDTTPEPGDIAVWNAGTFGHVEVVEGVNGDGSVTTSGYNKKGDGMYGSRDNQRADAYIDLNGTGKGINGEDLNSPSTPPPPDTDHDGIIDAEDQCAGVPGIPGLRGCPPKDIDRDGFADLVIVDTANNSTGVTEVHELAASGGYVNWLGHQVTAANYLDTTQQILMGDINADYRPDVVVVDTTNTSSGHVEVHALDGTNGFSTWIEHAVTPLAYTNPTQKFALADINDDDRDDLLVINTRNTGSGKVEIHALDAATHYSAWLGHWVTPASYLDLDTQQLLVGDANGDKRPDMLVVDTANTSSGLSEVHELNGANGFSTWQAHWVLPVGPLSPTQRLAMGDANADKIDDLFIVNAVATGSGKVEVHLLNGATHYSTWLGHHIVTPLAALDPTQKVLIGG
jgi:surface antigen